MAGQKEPLPARQISTSVSASKCDTAINIVHSHEEVQNAQKSCPVFSGDTSMPCTVTCHVNGTEVTNALVDTGSTVSLISVKFMQQLNTHNVTKSPSASTPVISVTASPLNIVSRVSCVVELDNQTFPAHDFLVASNIELPVILGADFLFSNGASISFMSPMSVKFSKATNSVLAVKSSPVVTLPIRLAASCATLLAPMCVAVVECQPTEPMPSPCSETYVAEALTAFQAKHPSLTVGSAIVSLDPTSDGRVYIPVANTGDSPIQIFEHTHVSVLEKADLCSEEETEVHVVNHVSAASEDQLSSRYAKIDEYLHSCTHLPADRRNALQGALQDYHDVFVLSEDDQGACSIYPHSIDTGNHPPIRQATRRLPFQKRAELKSILEDMEKKGLISPSSSAWASPIVLVKKRDGSSRLCVDYRKLNSKTKPDAYPLPRMDDLIDSLGSCALFSTMDLASGYWQIELNPEDRPKSAFTTPLGLFEFAVMPMGCSNGPATFQRVMELVLSDLLLKCSSPICRVYFDDIIVASVSVDDHVSMLRKVFARLREANLKLKLPKCRFLQEECKFLGHYVSREGIATCPDKISAVRDWPTPKNVKEVRQFVGLASYYRRFVKNFAELAAPLNAVLSKDVPFSWTSACELSFEQLKKCLTTAPILAYPDYSEASSPFILDTDASAYGIGAVLSQEQAGTVRVIAYASRSLTKSERNYDTYHRELLSSVTFIQQFRCYLVGRKFLLRTDHMALKALLTSSDPRGKKARWIEVLSDYDFEIVHRKGKAHQNADSLSRSPALLLAEEKQTGDATFIGAVVSQPMIVMQPALDVLSSEDLRSAQAGDPDIQQVLSWYDHDTASFVRPPDTELASTSQVIRRFATELQHFSVVRDILWRRSFVDENEVFLFVVPESLKSAAISSVHDLAGGGHLGCNKTLSKCKVRFFWFGMTASVELHVRCCQICAQASSKSSHGVASLGSLQAGYRFERVCLDIVGPFPPSARGYRYILVVVDSFSRWAEAYPLVNMTTETVAEAFVLGWVAVFGVPESLHSDQGTQFTSRVFQQMCTMLSMTKTRTTPYHPAGNGLVERVNRTIVSLLRAHVKENEENWDKVLPLVMLAYRSAVHRATGFTPAKMMLGAEVRLPSDLVFGLPPRAKAQSTPQFVSALEKSFHTVFESARQIDSASHLFQKDYYDLKVHGPSLVVNDNVWLLNTAIPQGSGSKKFKWPWTGPYTIIEQRHPVYTLKSYRDQSITRVHFNRLKLCTSPIPEIVPAGDVTDVPQPPVSCPEIASFDQWPDAAPVLPAPPPQPPPLPPAAPVRVQPGRVRQLPGHLSNFVVPPPNAR